MNIGASLVPVGLSLLSVLDVQDPQMKHPPVELSEKSFEFRVVADEPVSHAFYFTNFTTETLQITNVSVTEPIAFQSATAKVLPGEVGRVTFGMTEPRIAGDYEGHLELLFKNKLVSNVVYAVNGRFVPAIEITPLPAFFIATQKGQTKSAALEIFNRTSEPIKILKAESDSKRFDVTLTTIVEGEYYALTLDMNTNAAPGRVTESITITTSSPKKPTFKIMANTLVREKVYTFPESLDFGQIDLKQLKTNQQLAELLSQTFMIYQHEGTNFTVTAETKIPFLKLTVERGESNDRYQLRVDVDVEKFSMGAVNGSIMLKTNDKEFSQLEIPVRGHIANLDEF